MRVSLDTLSAWRAQTRRDQAELCNAWELGTKAGVALTCGFSAYAQVNALLTAAAGRVCSDCWPPLKFTAEVAG